MRYNANRRNATNATPALNMQAKGLLYMATAAIPSIERLRQLLAYDPDTGKFKWRASETMCGTRNSRWAGRPALTGKHRQGYLQGRIDGKHVFAHRVAWALHYGMWPSSHIDHIDHDPSNNRIENLREVSSAENARNMSKMKNNSSGITGVYWCKAFGKWNAKIRINRKLINLGRFSEFEDAVRCRKAAEAKYGFHTNHGVDGKYAA